MQVFDLHEFPREVKLEDVHKGCFFKWNDSYFFKTEYRMSNENQQPMCFCVGSGEFAHFPNKGNEMVFVMIDDADMQVIIHPIITVGAYYPDKMNQTFQNQLNEACERFKDYVFGVGVVDIQPYGMDNGISLAISYDGSTPVDRLIQRSILEEIDVDFIDGVTLEICMP